MYRPTLVRIFRLMLASVALVSPLQPAAQAQLAVFDPIPKLARGTLPLLVLHGENDTLIAPAEGDAAHRAAGGVDKQLVLVPRRGHNDVSLSDVYWKSMGAFVSRLIGRPA